MSFPGSIKTFFEKVGSEIERLFGGKASVAQRVQSVITYIAPLVNTVLALADPAIAPLVARAIAMVQADLATVSVVVQGATTAAGSTATQTIVAALNSVKTNLSALLSDAGVKNSANFAKISAAVNLIMGEVEAVLTSLASA